MDKYLLKRKKDERAGTSTEEFRNKDNDGGPSQKKRNPPVPHTSEDECVDNTTESKRVPAAFERWKATNPWLHLNGENKAVCLICTEAFNRNLTIVNNPQHQQSVAAWVKNGFSAWKSAADRIKKHSVSSFHTSAAEILHKKGANVYQSLSDGNRKQMMDHRVALRVIFRTLRLFARQGIPFRGSDNDENSNFIQFLKERAEVVTQLEAWLKRTEHKWLGHEIQNEILELMANKIVSEILEKIKAAEFYSIMIDETPDNSRKEQISICLRVVTIDLTVKEYFLGFYTTPSTKAETLCEIVKDTFLRFNLSVGKLRGQCFDGAKNVSGEKSGLQARIKEIEPRALFIHCNAHNLNLVVQDAMGNVQEAKNFIGIVKEMITFVRDSPKRNAQFELIQSQMADEGEDESPNLVAFCPTR